MSQLNKMPRFTLSQLVVLAICSFAFVHGDFVADLSDSPFVTPLSGKNFAETVVSTAQVNLVLYYTSDCTLSPLHSFIHGKVVLHAKIWPVFT